MQVSAPKRRPLTVRQAECVLHLAAGKTRKQIALELGLSHSTVRTHLEQAYWRLGVPNGTAAVAHAFRHGIDVQGGQTVDPPRVDRLIRTSDAVPPAAKAYLEAFDAVLRGDGNAGESLARAREGLLGTRERRTTHAGRPRPLRETIETVVESRLREGEG